MRTRDWVTKVHRAVLARLDGNDDAMELALDQLGDCPCCLRRALRYSVALLASEMSHDEWDHRSAVSWLEYSILQSLDCAQRQAQ